MHAVMFCLPVDMLDMLDMLDLLDLLDLASLPLLRYDLCPTHLQVIELSDTAFYPDQIHRLSRMRILMGVHGAGLGSMIWMEPERGGVVEIMVSQQGYIGRGALHSLMGR